jgi:small GTP-binding protein
MTEKRKICLLGATGVGKTSLVARFVRSIFSDVYRTTIGVTIDTMRVRGGGRELDLVIWDLSGEDEFQSVNRSYMRGAAGLLVTVDGTRRGTLETALRLHEEARGIVDDVPRVFVLNKSDLVATWEIDAGEKAALRGAVAAVVETSAKTGAGVEDAFGALVGAMAERDRQLPSRGLR